MCVCEKSAYIYIYIYNKSILKNIHIGKEYDMTYMIYNCV